MSITIPDAPGIDAAGNVKTAFVLAIADPSAPTLAEITAGSEITCALYGFEASVDQPVTTRAKRCYRQPVQSPGRAAYSIAPIEYDYDPQLPASADYAYADLTPGVHGYIVDRLGKDKEEAWAAGDIVVVYPVTLGERVDVPIDATSTDSQKLRVSQTIFVRGDVLRDIALVAA